jgi:hypothetical protein
MNKLMMVGSKGTKTYSLLDDTTPGLWSEHGAVKEPPEAFLVPTLYAAFTLRCKAMADLPFTVYKGDAVFDSSDDWQNKVGFLPDPARTLWLAEASLISSGSFYFFRERGRQSGQTKGLKYFSPSTIKVESNAVQGVTGFTRRIEGRDISYDLDDLLYGWLPDPQVEIGPPTTYPLKAALMAANASYSVLQFIAVYMQGDAAKTTLLGVKSPMPPQAEKEKIENWFRRNVFNPVRSLRERIFNADAITPVVIGEGMEGLKDMAVSADLQRQILTALGVPASLLLADAANYATAQQDIRNLYVLTTIPDARLFEQAINAQIFAPSGYRFSFDPQRLESFQSDESDNSAALAQLYGVMRESVSPGDALLLSMDIMGFDIAPEQRAAIESAIVKEEQGKEAASAQAQTPEPEEPAVSEEEKKALIELDKWEAKAARLGGSVAWHVASIPLEVAAPLRNALRGVESEAEIEAHFGAARKALRGHKSSDLAPLLAGINAGIAALRATQPVVVNVNTDAAKKVTDEQQP